MRAHFCLTILKSLHQSIRISQSSKENKSLWDPVVRKHSEPLHVGDVAFSSGLPDAPDISYQDLSSLVEWDSLPLKKIGVLHKDNIKAMQHVNIGI